jgi:hypothetical protein
MLYILTNILQFQEFLEYFKQTHGTSKLLDLSKVPISKLSEESMSVVNHHSECGVFLGYLEPGWMLESAHQVQLRKLIRKFPVAMVSKFVDSIPFSWKNETHSIYTQVPLNHHIREDGSSKVVNDGSSVHHEPEV